jgi:hypothetical protein
MKKYFLVIAAFVWYLHSEAQNVGIGVAVPAEKLDVNGNLKVSGAIMPAGQTGTSGQVLTSAGAGIAPQWKNTAFTGGGRFWIIPTNNTRTAGGFTGRGGFEVDGALNLTSQTDSLDYGTTNVTGTEFTISNPGLLNNYITVNKTGLYHFEGTLRYFVTGALSVTMLPRATVNLLVNSTVDLNMLLFEDLLEKTGGSETSSSTNTYNYSGRFELNIHLSAGSTVTFNTGFNNLRYPSSTDLVAIGISTGGYVSGQFVAE